MEYVAAVDLGGTKIVAAIAGPGGRVLGRGARPTGAGDGPGPVIDRMVAAAEEAARAAGLDLRGARAMAVGAPGPLDVEAGVVLESPNLGWRDVPLREILTERLGIPVRVENDANLAAYGEYRYGAGQGARHMVYLGIGTGIGFGLILLGRIYHGATGNTEFGHMTVDLGGPLCGCGRHGCLEAIASGSALAREARAIALHRPDRLQPGETPAAPFVFRLAREGDGEAQQVLDRFVEALGAGVANLVNGLSPDRVVLGGGVMAAGDWLLERVREEARRRTFGAQWRATEVVRAGLGGDSGLYGAVALALDTAEGR